MVATWNYSIVTQVLTFYTTVTFCPTAFRHCYVSDKQPAAGQAQSLCLLHLCWTRILCQRLRQGRASGCGLNLQFCFLVLFLAVSLMDTEMVATVAVPSFWTLKKSSACFFFVCLLRLSRSWTLMYSII